jgi:hypothetical protein
MRAFSQLLDLAQELIDHPAGFTPADIHQDFGLIDMGDMIPDDRLLGDRSGK